MKSFGDWTVEANLTLLATGSVLGLVLLTAIGTISINRVKVHGPLYQQIVQEKDLLADILPPPAYIIEAYLTAQRIIADADPSHRQGYIDQLAPLERDLRDREAFWREHLPQGRARELFEQQVAPNADAFFTTVDSSYVPAVKAGQLAQRPPLKRGDAATRRHPAMTAFVLGANGGQWAPE